MAADEAFCMPLAVTICSMLQNLSPDSRVAIYVLDNGISASSQQRLRGSWNDPRATVHWHPVQDAQLAEIPTEGRLNNTTYVRMLLGRLLPESVKRVIFLDSDLLVLGDITALWRLPFEGAECLAVQDISTPFMDGETAFPDHCDGKNPSPQICPIPNYRDLGFSAKDPYFNAGVLSIALAAWRNRDVASLMLSCLERNRSHILYWDQYVLNAELHGRWRPIPLEWNVGTRFFPSPPYWVTSMLAPAELAAVKKHPKIIHFTTSDKPWLPYNRHPFRRQFFKVLDHTAWQGWRPVPQWRRSWFLMRVFLAEWVSRVFTNRGSLWQ